MGLGKVRRRVGLGLRLIVHQLGLGNALHVFGTIPQACVLSPRPLASRLQVHIYPDFYGENKSAPVPDVLIVFYICFSKS
jgi:hypothetical protein